MKLLIFSILVIVQYLMDRFTSKCATYTGEVLLFIHHIMAVYIYFGPFFFNPFYHLIFCIILLFHWYTYEACIVTRWTNYYCGVDIKRPLSAQNDCFWWGYQNFSQINKPYNTFQRIVRGYESKHKKEIKFAKDMVICTLFKQPLSNNKILAGIFDNEGKILELFESN